MTVRLELGGLVIDAYSVGGVETCFQIPEFDVCLDIGRCPPGAERRKNLLLTHAHIDHASGLPYYVSMRGLMGMTAPRVYCPTTSAPMLQHILDSWATLQADSDRCTLQGVEPGEKIQLASNAYAITFRSPHRIECVGYTIFRQKKKLRPELAGLPGDEIASRARAGEAVNEVVEFPALCFPGDTRIDVVDAEESVRRAKVLILECTFVGEKVEPAKATRTGHVHLDQIAERADLFQNEHIVLSHFSRRHSKERIQSEVKAKLPAHLYERVTLLLHD